MEEFDILNEVTVFRKTLNKLSYSFFPNDMVNNGIQIVPVQWRKDIEVRNIFGCLFDGKRRVDDFGCFTALL